MSRKIETKVKNITVIHNDTNRGFLQNCNYAAKVAKGKYIYLLNNDTQLIGDSITCLMEALEKNENYGATGSKLITYSGKLQEAGCLISKDGRTVPIGKGENPLLSKYNILKSVDYCSGASLMIRKDLWIMLNGFDPIYGSGYYEETDLCMQIKKLGYQVVYVPQSEVVHLVSQSFGTQRTELIDTNKKLFWKKWKDYLENRDI